MRQQGLRRGLPQGLCFIGARGLVHPEPERFQPSDEFAFDSYFTLVTHLGQKALLLFEPAKQNTCPPVHKSLCQCAVQRIR